MDKKITESQHAESLYRACPVPCPSPLWPDLHHFVLVYAAPLAPPPFLIGLCYDPHCSIRLWDKNIFLSCFQGVHLVYTFLVKKIGLVLWQILW